MSCFPKLDLKTLSYVVFSDASFNNLHDGGSQGRYIVLLCDENLKCSPISWGSNKLKRIAHSTLAAETLALSDGTDAAFCMSKLTCEITNHENLPIHCFTDSRSLFEASGTSSLVSDRRLHVEIGAIRQMVSEGEISLK